MSQATTHRQAFEREQATERDWRSIAGLCFGALAAQFMLVIMAGAAMVPSYDFRSGAISDLGVFPETALLFNASLILAGVLAIAGGYAYYRAHGKRWLLALFAVAGIGAIGAGAVPLNAGGLHGLFALLAFLFFNLLVLGTATQLGGAMRLIAVFAGLVGLAFVVIMAIGDAGNPAIFGPLGHGGAERMIVYPVMLWLVFFGGSLVGSDSDDGIAA